MEMWADPFRVPAVADPAQELASFDVGALFDPRGEADLGTEDGIAVVRGLGVTVVGARAVVVHVDVPGLPAVLVHDPIDGTAVFFVCEPADGAGVGGDHRQALLAIAHDVGGVMAARAARSAGVERVAVVDGPDDRERDVVDVVFTGSRRRRVGADRERRYRQADDEGHDEAVPGGHGLSIGISRVIIESR